MLPAVLRRSPRAMSTIAFRMVHLKSLTWMGLASTQCRSRKRTVSVRQRHAAVPSLYIGVRQSAGSVAWAFAMKASSGVPRMKGMKVSYSSFVVLI